MEPASRRICPICTQALRFPTVYHPVGKDHPMHLKCFRLMMNTMEECPVCTQPTKSILEGLLKKNALSLTLLDGFERLNELNEQLKDENELIEGYDNVLTLDSTNRESVATLKKQRDEAVQRREALLSRFQSLAALMHSVKWISAVAENALAIIKNGKPDLLPDDSGKRTNQSASNSLLRLPESSSRRQLDQVEQRGQEEPSVISSRENPILAYRHLGLIATKQYTRRKEQLERVKAAIKDIEETYAKGRKKAEELRNFNPVGHTQMETYKATLQELLDLFQELNKLKEVAEAQQSDLIKAAVYCNVLRQLDSSSPSLSLELLR